MREWEKVETKQLRVVPVDASIDTTMAVATYDTARELVKAQDAFAVADCICRKEAQLVEKGCEHPMESCLTFGYAARYYIENGTGREITSRSAWRYSTGPRRTPWWWRPRTRRSS